MDKWLRNTNVVRVIALLIGILLWVVVHLEDSVVPGTPPSAIREQKIYNVSVTPQYDPNQFYISSIEPSTVQVTIRGRDTAIKKVTTTNDYRIELDLSKVGKGEHLLNLNPVGFPSSLSVEVFPKTVKVTIEEKQKKELPVIINVKGIPGVGLKVGQPIIKPNKVHVTIPTSQLDEIETVRGDVSVDKAQSAVTKQVKLQAYDKNGKELPVDISPPIVDVEIPITSPFVTMPLQIKLNGDLPKGFAIASVTQDFDKVTVFGTQEVLDRMEFYEGPQIDLRDIKETKVYLLDIPLRNKVTQIDPAKVNVTLQVVPSVSKAIENIPITIIGQNDGVETKVAAPDTGKINITVEGAPSIIDHLKLQDVQAFVDVSNLPPGKHELNVSLNLPTFVKKGSQQEYKATVEISAKQPKILLP